MNSLRRSRGICSSRLPWLHWTVWRESPLRLLGSASGSAACSWRGVGRFAWEGVFDQTGGELFEQPILAEDLLGTGVMLPELVEELVGFGGL
ncbi:hypothetical protein KR51_00015880 [Rubidibacter lacunae KORDI 51-2]|uniref:Uncharacterized protein n=1 Tax=Rubidibacter lacunae KORDI 51-2 TaxID=582515 RepID=U5DJ75_9CHRO|nr:hypothetical protein KR51_00015880 [Rubidibacter lacunae KORDI 51-2]